MAAILAVHAHPDDIEHLAAGSYLGGLGRATGRRVYFFLAAPKD